MVLKRLPLKGVHNLRDLGGYAAEFNKATKWKTVFRADGLFELDREDIASVMNYCKMKTVIDLRGKKELTERPNVFAETNGLRFEHVPLIPEDRDLKEIEEEWKTLETGYTAVARLGKSGIKKVFDIITETLPSPVLYHCTAGKDRTGIISCLLLGACGVDDFDIVSDYEVSSTYIRRDLIKVTDPGREINMDYIVSPPGTMLHFIEHITSEYGSVSNFLTACGIETEKINHIKRNLLVDIALG